MAGGTSDEVKPKRVLRKRTASNSAQMKAEGSSRVPRKRATRQRATRAKKEVAAVKVEKKEVVVETPKKEEKERKAPTPLSAEALAKKKERRRMQIHIGVTVMILLIGVGSSAVIGYSDIGVINVNSVIENRNQKVRDTGSNDTIVPVQNTSLEPDGGLIGLGIGTPTQKPDPEPEETATSTATSSDAVTEETETEETEESEESIGQVPATASEAAATTN